MSPVAGAVGREAGASTGFGGSAATVAMPVESFTSGVPSETLSPSLTSTSATVPEAGEGTSIVALSDSISISGPRPSPCRPASRRPRSPARP